MACALRTRKLASEVIGVGRDQATLDQARRLGAIDRGTTDMADGVAAARSSSCARPSAGLPRTCVAWRSSPPSHTLVTDAGSTKRQIIEAVERHPRSATVFVGAHPLAGSEQRGGGARASRPVRRSRLRDHAHPAHPARADEAGTAFLGVVGMPGCRDGALRA